MDMNTVEKLLTTTRSVRKRLDLDREVPLDTVKGCLEMAIQAPTGSNSQQWRYLVITDPEKRKAIAPVLLNSMPKSRLQRLPNCPLLIRVPSG